MFNYKIIFRFFSLVFIAWIFFGLSNVFGACTLWTVSPRIWYGVAWNSTNPTTCASITGSWPQRFNNNSVNDTQLQTFLKSYWFTYQTITCGTPSTAAVLVRNLQSNLVSKWCITCVDGKYWEHTQAMLSQCVPDCSADWKKPVNLQGQICDPWYTYDINIWCCVNPCPAPKSLPTNWTCSVANWLTWDWAWCCVLEPKLCNNTFTQSNRDYWVSTTFPSIANQFDKDNCCRKESNVYSKPPLLNNITAFCDFREIDCWLASWSLNDITVNCVNRRSWNSCCADTTCRPTWEPRPSNLPDCDMNVVDREADCGLAPWTLNNTTVSCINLQWNSCCIDTWCRPQLEPKPSLVDCSAETLNPNTCTATWQVWTLSGTSRNCTSCWSWTKSNIDHTKCICDSTQKCCGIQLNTVVPFIWDCIEMSNEESAGNTTRVNALNAFPILMWSLSKMLVTAILIFSFVMIVIWWVLIISWWINESNFKKWKEMIWKVIIWLALLWASWIILRLINPNFFW